MKEELARWNNVRETMGYIRRYTERISLATTAPRGDIASTGHALVSSDAAHPEILVYAPSGGNFSVNLTGIDGSLAVEWMNPATGARIANNPVKSGEKLVFTPPFDGDAVLYLRRIAAGSDQK